MFSQTTEYALRAVVFMAMNAGAHTTQQISAVTKVPSAYLSKVLQALVKAGIINSQRGVGGGFVLSKSAEELTIIEVVNAVDPIKRIRTCPLALESHGAALCALHKRLDDAAALIETAFSDTTIGDMLANPTQSVPLYESN